MKSISSFITTEPTLISEGLSDVSLQFSLSIYWSYFNSVSNFLSVEIDCLLTILFFLNTSYFSLSSSISNALIVSVNISPKGWSLLSFKGEYDFFVKLFLIE